MKKQEKDALLQYIEFHLIRLCERTEKNLKPNAVGTMYNDAYNMLSDLENTIDEE